MFGKKKDKAKEAEELEQDSDESGDGDKPLLEPLTPATQKRLKKIFDHGSKQAASGNYDYASDMFATCVAGAPGNMIYIQNFLANLIKKYGNDKKGAKMGSLGSKTSMMTAQMKKDWVGVIKAGLECLKLKPWDAQILQDIAAACHELELEEPRLAYLVMAIDGNPEDVGLNKKAADAFVENEKFDEAIKCLERVVRKRPNDDETARKINALTVQKTIHKGGYEEAETSIDVSVNKRTKDLRGDDVADVTPEQKLRREIRRHPQEVTNYQELADLFMRTEDFASAMEVMKEAIEATGSPKAREYYEDIEITQIKRKIAAFEKSLKAETDKERREVGKKRWLQMRKKQNDQELKVFSERCERYPGNFIMKYEYGLRLMLAGEHKEAIDEFQKARAEPRTTAKANYQLGKCFEKIEQFSLARTSYQEAVRTSTNWDVDIKKDALYRAGILCKERLNDLPAAQQFLGDLASLDYSYKDVAAQLDAVAAMQGAGQKSK